MNRIQTFRKDAEYYVEAEALTLSPNFVFSDFSLKHSEHTLEFKWKSMKSENVCTISFNACEDYPDNCFLSWSWDKTGEQHCSVCTDRLPELLPLFGENLLRKELNISNQKRGGDGERESPCDIDCSPRSSAMSDIVEGTTAKVDSAGERTPTPCDQTMRDVNSDCAEDSDESFNTCDDDDDDEDASDYYNYDPVDFYRDKGGDKQQDISEFQEDEQYLASVHPLLKHDIELFKEVYGEVAGEVVRNFSNHPEVEVEGEAETKAVSKEECTLDTPFICTRYLEALGELDCDIHVPLKCVDLSPQMADAWGLHLDEPLVVRINFSSNSYLNHREPPKVDVLQKKTTQCSIKPQLKNIMKTFLQDNWHKVDNDMLKSNLKKSESMPCDLRDTAGADFRNDMASGFGLVKRPPKLGATKARTAKVGSESVSGDVVSKRGKLTKRHMSTPVMKPQDKKKENRTVRSMSTSQTEPDMSDSCPSRLFLDPKIPHSDIKKMPPLDDGFLVMLYKYIVQRVPYVNEFCVICDNPHVFSNGAMLMPSVCSRELCLFSFQTLGVMADTMADIATGADVVDLLITLAKAACTSHRKAKIFMPFPNIVDPDNPEPGKLAISEKEKDFGAVHNLMKQLPPMKSLVGTSTTNLSKMLQQKDRLLYPLLNWIIYSNRSHIVKLRHDQQLKIMATPHQFILLSSPPSQERIFQTAKQRYGSVFAFHGSPIENWHSIIRQGLMVATGTNLQVNGAAYGRGIYLSPTASMSANYAGMGYSSHRFAKPSGKASDKTSNRFLQGKDVCCLALCEVINSQDLRKCSKDIWTCTNANHVCTRFFFVYEDGQVNSNDVDMDNPKHFRMVQEALAATFMAVVPKTLEQDGPSTVKGGSL